MQIKEIAIDRKAATEGIWVKVPIPGCDSELKIARISNSGFLNAVRKAFSDIAPDDPNLALRVDEEESRKQLAPLAAEYLWLDSKNLLDGKQETGKTVEQRTEILLDEDYVEVFAFIMGVAQDTTRYRQASLNRQLGNSSRASTGNSGGGKTRKRSASSKSKRRKAGTSRR